jgi:hypothetical protein
MLSAPAEPTKAYVASMLDEVPVLEVVVGATVELGRTVAAQITWDGQDRHGSTWHQEVSSSSPRSTEQGRIRSRSSTYRLSAERHVLRLRDSSSAAGRRLVLPIEVRVRDDLVRRRRAPRALILRRVRVTDERHIVATRKSAMDRGPDAGIRLRAGHDQASDFSLGQYLLQVGVLEGVAERLVHQRF